MKASDEFRTASISIICLQGEKLFFVFVPVLQIGTEIELAERAVHADNSVSSFAKDFYNGEVADTTTGEDMNGLLQRPTRALLVSYFMSWSLSQTLLLTKIHAE